MESEKAYAKLVDMTERKIAKYQKELNVQSSRFQKLVGIVPSTNLFEMMSKNIN